MNVGIGPVQVAQRFVQTASHGLENEPFVLCMGLGPGNGQAEFEWHVETRHAGSVAVQLHSSEIVNRIGATFDETSNPVEPPIARDSERGSRQEAYGTQRRDVGEVQEVNCWSYGMLRKTASLVFGMATEWSPGP